MVVVMERSTPETLHLQTSDIQTGSQDLPKPLRTDLVFHWFENQAIPYLDVGGPKAESRARWTARTLKASWWNFCEWWHPQLLVVMAAPAPGITGSGAVLVEKSQQVQVLLFVW